MHILLIHQNFAALNEAGGTRHHELARYLVARGHQVTVVTSRVSYLSGAESPTQARLVERQVQDGVTLLRAYIYPALHRSFVHRVFSFISFMVSSFLVGLRVKQVDLVWGTSPPIFQGLTAWSLARLKRVPFLFEVRDLWPAFAIEVGVLRNRLLIRASEWLERFLYRQADHLVINSPGFSQHVRQRGARRLTIIPNAADPAMFDPAASGLEFARQHGLEGQFIALYAGAHGMSNDLGIVLEAARLLRDRPDIALVLLGDGKEKANLVAQAQAMGLTNLHFLPPRPKTEMAAALAASRACIAILKPIPLYATVYPNKVFDYLAAGRPVVLAIGGVIREVVEEARAGIPVPPGDAPALAAALRLLADDPAAARQMGLNGRRHIETHFNRMHLAAALEELMLALTNPPQA